MLNLGFINPPSKAECPFAPPEFGGLGFREISRRCTPRKVVTKPARRDIEFAGSSVLNPWKRMTEAMIVDVEKPT